MELAGLGFWEQLTHTAFWVAVVQIIVIDILLAGDNAVVIALACRNLPPHLQKKGIFWGVAGAIGLRVVLTAFAASLLTLPWLKIAGALALLWIGIKLLLPEDEGGEGHEIEGSATLARRGEDGDHRRLRDEPRQRDRRRRCREGQHGAAGLRPAWCRSRWWWSARRSSSS